MQQEEAIQGYLEYGKVLSESSTSLAISFAYAFPRLSKLLTAITFVSERTSSASFWYKGYSIILKYHQEHWYLLPVILEGRTTDGLEIIKDEEQLFNVFRVIDHGQLRQLAKTKTTKTKTSRKKRTA
jgi:hypothetical protein